MTSLLIAWCGTPGAEKLTAEEETCKAAIALHLESINQNIEETSVNEGDSIVVDYIGRLNDHEVFDTSIKTVAKACDKFAEQRDYDAGLPFVTGQGKMIKGFDEAVIGMKIGETKTVTLAPKDAYGEWDEKNLVPMKKSELPEGDWKKGDELPTFFGPMPITSVEEDTVTIDTNPPLAGKTLTFDITIKSVSPAEAVEVPTEEEVAEDTAE